jgi:hypothetical protein
MVDNMKDELLNPDKGTCDMNGCDNDAVGSNGVGAKLCNFHI